MSISSSKQPNPCCVGNAAIDNAIERATAESSKKNIIHGKLGDLKLGPKDWRWLYRRWHGTVLQLTWVPVLVNTAAALIIIWAFRSGLSSLLNWNPAWPQWPHFTTPAPNHPVIMRMAPLHLMWTTCSTLTTFILTFFLTESFAYWRRTLCEARKLQRAICNVALLQSTHAARDPSSGEHTPAARRSLEQTASELRLLQIMFWSHMLETKTLGILQTAEGLSRMEERGLISTSQHAALSATPRERRHDLILQLLAARLVALQRPQDRVAEAEAVAAGGFADVALTPSSYDFERRLDDVTMDLREACHVLTTDKAGRMPLAYVHLVQLLVDTLTCLTAPALYPKIGIISVALTALLTLFYRGLLELSKSFLDAFGLRTPGEQPIEVDVLMSEVNADLRQMATGAHTLPEVAGFRSPT